MGRSWRMNCQQAAEQIKMEIAHFKNQIAAGTKPPIKAVGAPVAPPQKQRPLVKSEYPII
jgi:hypothetical protein